MKTILTIAVALLLVCGSASATWDDAKSHGLFPYWQTGGNWYTFLTFVNASEETGDVISVRFRDFHGSPCDDTKADMYSIREGEMLVFSTTASVPHWIPTTSEFGYIMFCVDEGGFIYAYCVIYNQMTGSGYIVPACRQDKGF